ncbi:hypothetical protein [Dulcicalothrix desertica]|nr:hypothetical protein [Dulcicalothrix desertica]
MQSAQPMRKIFVSIGLTLSVVLAIFLISFNSLVSYGADSPDQVIEQYLLALENKDEDSILKLIPREYSAKLAVEDKIVEFGGNKIQERKIIYNKIKPVYLTANVQGFYTNSNGVRKKFEDTLIISYRGGSLLELNKGRWYLKLGNGNVPAPEVQPAEPQTSPPKKSSL